MRLNSSQSSPVSNSLASRNLRSSKVLSCRSHHKISSSFPLDVDLFNFQTDSPLLPHRAHHRNSVSKQRKAESFVKTRSSARTLPSKKETQLLHKRNAIKAASLNAPQGVAARACRASACTTIGRKRVVGVDGERGVISRVPATSPQFTCPDRSPLASADSQSSPRKRFSSPTTPSTPAPLLPFTRDSIIDKIVECGGDSALEGLPFDLLVRIVCCLQHDELKPVLQVCRRLQEAVSIAMQCHFNFTTPGRGKKEKLGSLVPQQDGDGRPESGSEELDILARPPTPKAPRQIPKPADARFSMTDTRPFAPRLFQEPASITSNCRKSSRFLSRPIVRGAVSLRVLFYEEELCEKVARNVI